MTEKRKIGRLADITPVGLGCMGFSHIFDFALDEHEMEEIRQMDTGKGSHDPEADGVAEMLLGAFDVHADK